MDQGEVIEMARRDFEFLSGEVLGILLYGSWARNEAYERSDIDICVVAPQVKDKVLLWRSIIARIRDDRYDIRIFELMPLYLKMAVIKQGLVVYSRDVPELYEYFYPFRRIWGDQEHRQRLSREDALALFSHDDRHDRHRA